MVRDRPPTGPGPRGFTLIELLVVIGVLGLLVALLLPAVQAAREVARRTRCLNNLRQIGMAHHHYQGVHHSFPLGRVLTYDARYTDARVPCAPWVIDRGSLVAILPYLEQSALYASINQDLSIFGGENRTALATRVDLFICPSDPDSGTRIGYPLARLPAGGNPFSSPSSVAIASYAGCHGADTAGALPESEFGCRVNPARAARANGCITDVGPVTPATITDGLSQSLLVMERANAPLRTFDTIQPLNFIQQGWWLSGDFGDTLTTTFYPPNARRFLEPNLGTWHAFSWSASSLHPGGLNVAFADGSARFVRETIDSWPFDPNQGLPIGWPGPNGARPGVWQALGTRNGGEAIPSDGF